MKKKKDVDPSLDPSLPSSQTTEWPVRGRGVGYFALPMPWVGEDTTTHATCFGEPVCGNRTKKEEEYYLWCGPWGVLTPECKCCQQIVEEVLKGENGKG